MKNSNTMNRFDLIFIIGIGVFFFSCIATTMHVAKTLEPGQGEMSAGYMQARSFENFGEDPIQLLGVGGRIGIVDNLDLGMEHSFDITKNNEGQLATFWGDVKYQLTNRNNEFKKLTFSTGLVKGYVYDKEVKYHITSIQLYFSISADSRLTPTFMYRFELTSEDKFIPDSFRDPRHTVNLGLEYCLQEPTPNMWTPKFAIGLGTMNSITGDPDGESVFLFNFGFKFTSPGK